MALDFHCDVRLVKDSDEIMQLPLCAVRLMKNADFPWVLLIPQRPDCIEILDLTSSDRAQLFDEIVLVSEKMQQLFKPTKLNIANLGNQVPQLHVHVIARYDADPAWPNPVWGSGIHQCYLPEEKMRRIALLQDMLR